MKRNSILRHWASAMLALLFLVPSTQADEELTRSLGAVVDAYGQVHGFAGSVRVVVDNETRLEMSVGPAERAFGQAHGPDTRVSINSISKTFTAVAVLRLAARGELDLDAPIARYLPDAGAAWASTVTAHHLLSHSSGLPREAGLDESSTLTLAEQLPRVVSLPLGFEPGTGYGYSNAGYIVLGNLLEAVAQVPFSKVIEAELLQPLGLKDTGLYVGQHVVERQAVPYRFGPDGVTQAQRSKTLGESAGGGMYSTPADLDRFVRALENDTLLDAYWRERLFAAHAAAGEGGHEAYAWSIKNFGLLALRFAAGSGYGTKSVLIRHPGTGLTIAIVSNWGTFPILDLLRDLFLLTQGADVAGPDGSELVKAEALAARLGRYRFDAEALRRAIQTDDGDLVLHAFKGRVFLDEELLAIKGDGVYGLTYTDELTLHFSGGDLVLTMNGQELRGRRVE